MWLTTGVVLILLAFQVVYRYFSDRRFDALIPTLVLWSAIQAALVSADGGAWGWIPLMIAMVLALILAVVAGIQRDKTNKYVHTVLYGARKNVDADIHDYCDLASILVEVDVYPDISPEARTVGRKRELREFFLGMLPDAVFDKGNLNQRSLLLPAEQRRFWGVINAVIALLAVAVFVAAIASSFIK